MSSGWESRWQLWELSAGVTSKRRGLGPRLPSLHPAVPPPFNLISYKKIYALLQRLSIKCCVFLFRKFHKSSIFIRAHSNRITHPLSQSYPHSHPIYSIIHPQWKLIYILSPNSWSLFTISYSERRRR